MHRGGGGQRFNNDRNRSNGNNDRFNNNQRMPKYNLQQQPKTSFGSGMTSQQRYHSIVENVKLDLAGKSSINNSQNEKGCQMHPKVSKKCRKCLQIQSSAQTKLQKQKYELIEKIPEQIKLNNDNPKSHLNQKFISNITNSEKYQKLRQLKSVKETLHELTPQEIPLQAYRRGTTQDPTFFAVFLYRLMELKPTKPQLTIMLKDKNVNIKALALLYIRIAFDYQLIYAYLSNSFQDYHLINAQFTVGQYAKKLLLQSELQNSGIRLPRIPIRIQKQINQKLQNKSKKMEHNFNHSQINNNNNINIMQGNTQVLVESSIPVLENIAEKRNRSRDGRESSCSSSSSSSGSSSSSSPDNFSSSSSSGSSSQKQSKQKVQKVMIKQPPRPKGPSPKQSSQSISLQSLKQRIKAKQDLVDMQSKRQSLLSKYQAQSKLSLKQQNQSGQINQESESLEKYQINKR